MNAVEKTSPLRLLSNESLEDVLLLLCQYGRPRMTKFDTGWYCAIDVFVMKKGVEFKVDSAIEHTNPKQAAKETYNRLREALISLVVTP